MNETHDPSLTSWVESANRPSCDFPIQNLPFGVFNRKQGGALRSIGVAIGDSVLDLGGCAHADLLQLSPCITDACKADALNTLMSLGPAAWSVLRRRLSEMLRKDSPDQRRAEPMLVHDAIPHLPARIGDYTDFYASIHHATNVGRLFRPDNPLLPNYKYVPIGYHGRASSIVISGSTIRRPCGQFKNADSDTPSFGATRLLDYELEAGFFAGLSNGLGDAIPLSEAESHIFGACLVNDWSARDFQAWEYQPLGPFLAKNFGTSISPWIVTLEALAPFRVPAASRADGDPPPLPYLSWPGDQAQGAVDIALEVFIRTAKMRAADGEAARLTHGNLRDLYWTPAQLLTHHTSNGCNLQPGDLFASGTVSGPLPEARGCLLELTQRGADPVHLPNGETRKFLEDGDEIIFRGYCEREGAKRIGFGECRGIIAPAIC